MNFLNRIWTDETKIARTRSRYLLPRPYLCPRLQLHLYDAARRPYVSSKTHQYYISASGRVNQFARKLHFGQGLLKAVQLLLSGLQAKDFLDGGFGFEPALKLC
jgi:hypothetical protein